MWHFTPHTLSSSEQVLIPQFSFSNMKFFSRYFQLAGRGRVQCGKYEDERTHREGGGGCGAAGDEKTLQLFHFVPFILMIFYVMSCHTHILSVFMAVRCSNAWNIQHEQLGRYKIILPRPFVWVFFHMLLLTHCPIYWIVHIPATIQIWKLYNG